MFELLGAAISFVMGVVFLQREEELLGSRFVEGWKWYRCWSWTYHNLLQPGAARLDLLYVRQGGYEHEVMYVRECVLRQYTLFWACERLVDAFCGWVRVFTRIGALILGGVVIFGAVLVWRRVEVENVADCAWARYFTVGVMILFAIWGLALTTTLMYYRTCAHLLLQRVLEETCAFETPEKMFRSLGIAPVKLPPLDDWLGRPGTRPRRRPLGVWLVRVCHRFRMTLSWLRRGKWHGLRDQENGANGREGEKRRRRDDERKTKDLAEIAEFLLPWRRVSLLRRRVLPLFGDGPRAREIVRRLMPLLRDVDPEAAQWIEGRLVGPSPVARFLVLLPTS
jgi:hypothetical protein